MPFGSIWIGHGLLKVTMPFGDVVRMFQKASMAETSCLEDLQGPAEKKT